MKSVPIDFLQHLGENLPDDSRRLCADGPSRGFDLERWIADHGLVVEGPKPWDGGRRWIFPTCPWNPEHRNRSAFIVQGPNGAIGAGCLHNGCRDKDWHALRDLVEPGWQSTHRGAMGNALWEAPVPFHQFDLPPFPTDVFPGWLRAFVEAEARATQTPVDLAGMLTLSAPRAPRRSWSGLRKAISNR